jgi:hypothetical protein
MSKQGKQGKSGKLGNAQPPRMLLTSLGTWLRTIADHAEQGRVVGFAGVAMVDGHPVPLTSIADPTGAERMTLAGSVAQLHHMLQASEHNDRMTSLAARPQA